MNILSLDSSFSEECFVTQQQDPLTKDTYEWSINNKLLYISSSPGTCLFRHSEGFVVEIAHYMKIGNGHKEHRIEIDLLDSNCKPHPEVNIVRTPREKKNRDSFIWILSGMNYLPDFLRASTRNATISIIPIYGIFQPIHIEYVRKPTKRGRGSLHNFNIS